MTLVFHISYFTDMYLNLKWVKKAL